MTVKTEITEAGQEYAAAHEVHYKKKDLRKAIGLYRGIITAYPDSREAKDAGVQIQNIVQAVVPKQVLFDAHLDLALTHIEAKG